MRRGSLRIWLISGRVAYKLVQTVYFNTKEMILAKPNVITTDDITVRMVHVDVSTAMTDLERSEILYEKLFKLVKEKRENEPVAIRLTISVEDSLTCRIAAKDTFELYAVKVIEKEMSAYYNARRLHKNVADSIMKPLVNRAASDITMKDAFDILGIAHEYLNEEGEYDKPDLVRKWGSLFRKSTSNEVL